MGENELKRLVRALNSNHSDFGDIYLQHNLSESWVLDEGIIKAGSFAVNMGVGVRSVYAEQSFLNYSNIINFKECLNLLDNLYLPKNIKPARLQNFKFTEEIIPNLYSSTNPIYLHSSSVKIKILEMINQLAHNYDYIHNVSAALNLEYDELAIIRSDNRIVTDTRPMIHLTVAITIKQGSMVERGQSGGGGRYELDFYNEQLLKKYVDQAYQIAQLKLIAKNAPSGEMPVVLGNGWSGVILHEAIGHGLEADFNRRGSSAFSNKIGQTVASAGVTVIDDGTLAHRRGSLNYDDEGNPTQRNILIENGVLKNYLYDEMNARLMNTKSSGNGRRESFAACPIPRMTNTFMLEGSYTEEEIIASVKDGIYASNFEGGQVDISSGQFVFNASVAWLIKDGKLAYPIKGCALVGNGPECLKYISMIANNLELDPGVGVCGKDSQSIPVGVGQPTIRLDGGLVVGGAAN